MSFKGPCLCGDPYCPSCGSPGAQDELLVSEWLDAIFYDPTKPIGAHVEVPDVTDYLLEIFGSDKVSDTFRDALITEAIRHFDTEKEKQNAKSQSK